MGSSLTKKVRLYALGGGWSDIYFAPKLLKLNKFFGSWSMAGIEILNVDFEGFAGHVSPQTAFKTLAENSQARLIDVRTRAEWQFVGVPILAAEQFLAIEWQSFPTMEKNDSFVEVAQAQISDHGAPLFLLCRSGARSEAAARTLAARGYRHAYNVAGGFEGDADAAGHRGTVNGWKFDGLPWRQA
jgi:rhodanese-related sulfurtransferase